jgi:hypothetical protein
MLSQLNELRTGSRNDTSDVIPFLLPLSFFCRQSWFQLLLLAGGISLAYKGLSAARKFEGYGVANFEDYQLVANDFQFSSSADKKCRDTLGNLSFNLLWNGCEICNRTLVKSETSNCSIAECIHSVSFVGPQIMDGFVLKPNSLSSCITIFSFRLIGYDKHSDSWITVGSSRFRRVGGQVRFLDGSIPVIKDMRFDHRAPLPLIYDEVWVPITCAICMLSISVLGATGRRELVRHLIICAFVLYAASTAGVGAAFLAAGLPDYAFLPLALAVSTSLLALLLLRAERQLALGLIAQGAWALGCRAVSECAIAGDCAYSLDPQAFSHLSALSLAFGLAVVLFIRRAVARAVTGVAADARAYDEAWLHFAGNPARLRVLRELVATTSTLARSCPAQASGPRHLHRRPLRRSASAQVACRCRAAGRVGWGARGGKSCRRDEATRFSCQLAICEEAAQKGRCLARPAHLQAVPACVPTA